MNSKFHLSKGKLYKNNNNISLTANSYHNNSKKNSKSINNTINVSSYQNNSSLNKINKKRLFKSVYSGFTKTSFGSIPYKTENFILNNKLKNPRFNDVKSYLYSDKLRNPGVGKYNLSKDFELTGWDTKFGGCDERFKTAFNLMPGAGDYDPEENKNYEKNRNNIRYKSLYKQPDFFQMLLKYNNDQRGNLGPNCTTYTPVYQDEVMKIKKLYTFDSFIGRDEFTGYDMPFTKKNDYPGPGFYTYNGDLFGADNKQLKFNYDNKSESFEDSEIKKNPDKVFKKYYKNKKGINFKLKSRSPKYNNIKVFTSEELQIKNKTEKENRNKVPELETLLKTMNKKEHFSRDFRFYINQQKELDYIKSILGNDNGKPDLFYLSSPRWKENKFKLKTPGPAYYFNHSLNSFKK